jgi:predicted glycosyltransferase involved in capsule biosynthesis
MLFPKIWSEPLFNIFDEETGILEPHIYQPRSKGEITLEYFEEKLPSLLKEVVYNKCRQTHPWLINTKIITKVGGYYDEIFSPQECEDDDFVFRVLNNGLKIKSTGMSWVVHYGQSIRNKVLPSFLNKHMQLFTEKNKISFRDFVNMFEIHPAYAD